MLRLIDFISSIAFYILPVWHIVRTFHVPHFITLFRIFRCTLSAVFLPCRFGYTTSSCVLFLRKSLDTSLSSREDASAGVPAAFLSIVLFLNLQFIVNYRIVRGKVPIFSTVAGHKSLASRECPVCATHIAAMPSESLTTDIRFLRLICHPSLCVPGVDVPVSHRTNSVPLT